MPYSLISVILGLLGLLSAYFVYLKVKSSSEGEGRVKEIGDEIVSIPSEASFILYWYALTYCLLLQLSLNESPGQYAKGNRRSSCSAAAAWSQSRGGFTCER